MTVALHDPSERGATWAWAPAPNPTPPGRVTVALSPAGHPVPENVTGLPTIMSIGLTVKDLLAGRGAGDIEGGVVACPEVGVVLNVAIDRFVVEVVWPHPTSKLPIPSTNH